jgi:signal transduction histidine kinase
VTTSFSGAVEAGTLAGSQGLATGADGVLVLDAAQRCVFADAVLTHLFDLDTAGINGRLLADIALPGPLLAVLAETANAALAANGVRRASVSMDEGDAPGRPRAFSILAIPGDPTGANRVTLIVTPLTDAPAADGYGQPFHDARTAHLRAEAALFMRDHVLGVVSHDLRGPLNAIHSWGYVLERKVDANDPAAMRALGGIRSGVEQQVKLIEQLIDTTRAETKTLALNREPIALRHLMDGAAAVARTSLATQRGIALHVESKLVEEQITGDHERLTQALWLMLAFATEASAAGSTVVLTGRMDGSTFEAVVTFKVSLQNLSDTTLPHVLEGFARVQAAQPREAARIAWVLSLCKRVAEAHGGAFEHDDFIDDTSVALKFRVPASDP